MNKMARTVIIVSSIAIVAIVGACKAEAKDGGTSNSIAQSTPRSCQYRDAMDSCCPAYCNSKDKDGALRANESFLRCASGFSCKNTDVFSSRCELESSCKKK